MIKAIVIEDEVKAASALKKMLKIIAPEIAIISESTNVKEAVKIINESQFDLLFLDIQLKDGNAFELLDQCANFNFSILFTTAYNEYAIKAIKYSALDYLLKPINPEELELAIEKVKETIKRKTDYELMLKNFNDNHKNQEKNIVLHTHTQTYIVAEKNIIALQADGAYTRFLTTKGEILVSRNLKYYQDVLNATIFLRPHKSYIVNKNYIQSISDNFIKINDVISIPISVRKHQEINQLFKR